MSKCKVIRNKECTNGNHKFVISNWLITNAFQKANAWTCQKCLHSVEGLKDIIELRESLHAEKNTETNVA